MLFSSAYWINRLALLGIFPAVAQLNGWEMYKTSHYNYLGLGSSWQISSFLFKLGTLVSKSDSYLLIGNTLSEP